MRDPIERPNSTRYARGARRPVTGSARGGQKPRPDDAAQVPALNFLDFLPGNNSITLFGVLASQVDGARELAGMGVPCLTMRDNTERPETVEVGTNELIGTNPAALKPALDRLFEGKWKKGAVPELWDGRTSERIVAHLEQLLA